MQLLVEEFFRKIFKFIDEINIWIIRWAIKSIFYILFAGIIAYLILSAIKRDFLPIILVLGILILGESAHFIRKTREKKMKEILTEKNSLEKKPKNKVLLPKTTKPKNKVLLNSTEKISKNKKSKILITKNKTISKNSLSETKIQKNKTKPKKQITKIITKPTSSLSKKHKIDTYSLKTEKAKNKTLLPKTTKPKNDDLLESV